MKWKIGILSVIVGVLVIYNLPYCEEIRAYNKVEDKNDLETCDWYIEKYPEGRHLDDVMYIKVKLGENNMTLITEYIKKFPDGKHITEINALCDKLWDAEIVKYNGRDKSEESPDAVKYMSEMLQYMKSHHINTILVDIHPTLDLKDYTEYDPYVREVLEEYSEESLSISAGMISLKSNFTVSGNSELMEILIDGVQKSMDKMFTPGFITIVANSKDENTENEKMVVSSSEMPHLTFNYTITSQEDKIGDYIVPHIWTYADETGKALNYLIGISVNFQAHFTIPGSSTTFDYAEKGEPSDDIENVTDIRYGYLRMTEISFARFSNKMSMNMGLAESYNL